ncbi:MAG: alpha/beta hydrolase [Actinobacteria bacterium]|nr:alpha/beta hydrolase [Actinomycetota bacterium]
MDTIEVDGHRIAYRAAGAGPPLLLLHGGLVDSRVWRRELDAFSDGFQVVAWDAPGCGGSSDPQPDASLHDYADSVATLVDALELGPVHVLGHSFGGGLALAVHQRYPHLVRSLILVSAYAGWAGSLPADEVERRRERAERDAHRPVEEWIDEFLATLFDDTTPRDLVDETRRIMLDVRPEGMLPMLHAFADADLTDALPGISVPTLLLYGEDDRRSPPPVAESLASSIPGSRLVFVPDAGHDVHVEAPAAFEHQVRSFLQDV